MRHALCGPSGQPPDELALAHGRFSPGPDAADGIASILDQIPAATWVRTDGVLAIIVAHPDTLKLKLVSGLCGTIHARLPDSGIMIYGTTTDSKMKYEAYLVGVMTAVWQRR